MHRPDVIIYCWIYRKIFYKKCIRRSDPLCFEAD
jgi:hypothetical protein